MRFTALLSLFVAAIAFAGVVRKDDTAPNMLSVDKNTFYTAETHELYESMLMLYEHPFWQGADWLYWAGPNTGSSAETGPCGHMPENARNVLSSIKFRMDHNNGMKFACRFYGTCNCEENSGLQKKYLELHDQVPNLEPYGWDNQICSMKCWWITGEPWNDRAAS